MARYPEIVSTIKHRIDEHIYTEKLPSLALLAKEFQVNINTIQRAMSELKRESYIYSVNGIGSFVAHSGSCGNKKIVTLYMRDFVNVRNYQLLNFIESLQKNLQMHELQLHVAVDKEIPDPEKCQAILIYTWSVDNEHLEILKRHIMPEKIYFLERFAPNEQLFAIDNYAGGAEAIDYLYMLGHRNIAILSYSQKPEISFYERVKGASAAAAKYQDLQLTVYDLGDSTEAYEDEVHQKVFPQITSAVNMPDAVFALTDRLALYFIRHCRNQNISVPEDISVIGYDNEKVLQFFEPALTTFEEPYAQLAELVVKRLLNPIRHPEEPSQIYCRPLLIERQSVKKRDIISDNNRTQK